MLFFIKVEKNRMIPITSMEPMNAPIMTDRNPDKVNTPAVIVPAPASMTKATPKLAPELIPSMEGSAKGLLWFATSVPMLRVPFRKGGR